VLRPPRAYPGRRCGTAGQPPDGRTRGLRA